ncbi:MAG TPA: DDE-type integrase/transposase/recombinase, partial [Candidatus Methylomirabilis sp.]
MNKNDKETGAERWARLRFAIIGRLLAAPPKRGELRVELERLSERTWIHPTRGEPVRFALATIERWYYRGRNALRDPIGALQRRHRKDAGTHPSLGDRLRRALRTQHRDHPKWSYRLHHDNLVALAREEPDLGSVPSYATVRRHMQATGLTKARRSRRCRTEGEKRAARRLDDLEVRSFEATHVHGLWHLDYHEGPRSVLTPRGEWVRPLLLGILDDCSRLCCHLQWYLHETAEALVHGLCQAIQKRALPRSLMTDNGAAMLAGETVQGLEDLSIQHETTLAHSPYQNGKQEAFWVPVETRLMAMLENVDPLTLDLLNEATQAWVEMEYNRRVHEEIGVPPVRRYLEGPEVGRPSPSSLALRQAFRLKQWRTQRTSDGTVQIEGHRFEVPSRYRQLQKIRVRYARWDLGHIDLVDPRTGVILSPLYPLDKQANADGRRRRLEPLPERLEPEPPERPGSMAPLLQQLMREYAATGLPPAYLPKHDG